MAKYTSILKLEVRHEYFTNGLCTDLIFSPTGETQNLIDGRRLIVKYRPAGLELFAPLDRADNLLIPVENDLRFQWSVATTSSDFYAVTALPSKDPNGHFIFTNGNAEAGNAPAFSEYGGLYDETEQSEIRGVGNLFAPFTSTHVLEARKSEQPVKLERLPVVNATKSGFVIDKAFEEDSFDLKSFDWPVDDRKTLKLKTAPLKRKTLVKITYPIAAKAGKDAFALLDIRLDKAFTKKKDTGRSYSLRLKAKEERWQYFIITGNTVSNLNGPWQLQNAGVTPSPEVESKELGEKKAPENEFPMAGLIWDRLKSRIKPNDEKAYFFYCKVPLSIKEKPLTDLVIQRKKGGDGWEDVITDLPAPGPQNKGVQIIRNPNFPSTT